ncbi:ABC transporter permease [Verrucomicrobia bacterium LW23]|nr:ABC transporter permease [Verrucomicrobia bacterium LW23]
MRRFAWRLLGGLGVLWGAATLTFLALHLTGGDPALTILGGEDATPSREALARVRAEYHLDQPLWYQYTLYLARLAQGDLGDSYRLRIPVTRAIAQQIGATAQLAFWAATVAVLLSITVAILTARQRPWIRSLVSGAELVISSMPGFVIGIILLLVFAFQLKLLPASGSAGWLSMVLPTITLALPIAAVLTQVLRQELEDILEQPFILTARARGMSEVGVRLRHALRHALIPLVTLSGFIVGSLLGGAVIAESLFARQGIGRLMIDATMNKDVPIVLGITLLSALVYVVINLVVDVLYTIIDPRLKGV